MVEDEKLKERLDKEELFTSRKLDKHGKVTQEIEALKLIQNKNKGAISDLRCLFENHYHKEISELEKKFEDWEFTDEGQEILGRIENLESYNEHTFDAQLKENADIIQENKKELSELKSGGNGLLKLYEHNKVRSYKNREVLRELKVWLKGYIHMGSIERTRLDRIFNKLEGGEPTADILRWDADSGKNPFKKGGDSKPIDFDTEKANKIIDETFRKGGEQSGSESKMTSVADDKREQGSPDDSKPPSNVDVDVQITPNSFVATFKEKPPKHRDCMNCDNQSITYSNVCQKCSDFIYWKPIEKPPNQERLDDVIRQEQDRYKDMYGENWRIVYESEKEKPTDKTLCQTCDGCPLTCPYTDEYYKIGTGKCIYYKTKEPIEMEKIYYCCDKCGHDSYIILTEEDGILVEKAELEWLFNLVLEEHDKILSTEDIEKLHKLIKKSLGDEKE